MPTFRDRPLTWLFVIATACVHLAAWAAGHVEQPWVNILTVGEITVLGVWAALGESHRLARAGVVVALVLLLALPDYWTSAFVPLVHSTVLTHAAMSAILVTIAAFFWKLLLSPFSRRPQWFGAPLRFSVVELLGWMIVVAVVAASARLVDKTSVQLTAEFLVVGLIGSAYGTFLLVMWRLECFAPRTRAIVSLVAIGGTAALIAMTSRAPEILLQIGFLTAYQWGWHKVQQLDDARLNRPPSG